LKANLSIHGGLGNLCQGGEEKGKEDIEVKRVREGEEFWGRGVRGVRVARR
jgi:hypothetical protein